MHHALKGDGKKDALLTCAWTPLVCCCGDACLQPTCGCLSVQYPCTHPLCGPADGEDDQGEDEDVSEGGSDLEQSSLDGTAGGRKERHGARRAEPEIQQINKRTSKARQQQHETFDGPETLPNIKPMMELEAGRNIWYQAYVLKESLNEVKVRFPRTCKCIHRTLVKLLSLLPVLSVATWSCLMLGPDIIWHALAFSSG